MIKRKEIVHKIILHLVLIFFSCIMMVPFFWMATTSLKTELETFAIPIKWIPDKPIFSNYAKVFELSAVISLPRAFMNTMIIVLPTSIIGTFTSALAAYAFVKMRFPGKNKLFMMLILSMAIPGVVTMLPSYRMFISLGWYDTWLPLMVPGMLGGAGAIFFTRQFIQGLPDELDQAAKVDGLGFGGIFLRITLPLSKPILITNFIFGFLGGYNDFMGPLLYLVTSEKFTLQLALNALSSSLAINWAAVMAGMTMSVIPMILVFIFAQRYFIDGIVMSGIKG